jgi:hypothetical protein
LTWTGQYNDKGLFQLVVNKTVEAAQILKAGNFVAVKWSDEPMQITSVKDADMQIWAYGQRAAYTILNDRYYAGNLSLTDAVVETTLRSAVSASRPAGVVELGVLSELTATATGEYVYPNLYTLVKTLCDGAGYGFRLRHDKTAKKLYFEVYNGTARANVKFSSDYGNMRGVERLITTNTYKNVCYVMGTATDGSAVVVVAGDTGAAGLDRHEMFLKVTDVSQGNDLTETEYAAILTARGNDALTAAYKSDEINFEANTSDFGSTYFLGDTITCILPEYGQKLTIKVTGFTVTIEKNEPKLELSIGLPIIRSL